MTNATGVSKTLTECGLNAKPVYLCSGDEGFFNDGHKDWADIQKNGEQTLEFGGYDVIDGSKDGQLDMLADYLWKDRGRRKHIYALTFVGTCHDISPSDVYTIAIGTAGETEYITSRAVVQDVRIEQVPGSLGMTQVVLRELEEAWKYDSNVYSRFVARGVLVQSPSNGSVVTVGSEYSTVATDFRVEIGSTSAEDVINAAIDFVSGALGGGTVHLTKGTFRTDGVITIKAGVTLEGEGDNTIIEKNHALDGITCDGGSGTEIDGAGLYNLKVTRNAADTSSSALVYLDYADSFVLRNVTVTNAYATAIRATNCDGLAIRDIRVSGLAIGDNGTGIHLDSNTCTLNGIFIDGLSVSRSDAIYGLYVYSCVATISDVQISNFVASLGVTGIIAYNPAGGLTLSNISIKNLDSAGGAYLAYGILLSDMDGAVLSDIHIDDIDNTVTAANSYGIYLDANSSTPDDNTLSGLFVTGCSGTGVYIDTNGDRNILVGRSTGNGTNLTDNGANTNTAAFDAT